MVLWTEDTGRLVCSEKNKYPFFFFFLRFLIMFYSCCLHYNLNGILTWWLGKKKEFGVCFVKETRNPGYIIYHDDCLYGRFFFSGIL